MAEHDLHKLVGHVVAQVMLDVADLAHVVGLAVIERGDDVPGRAAADHEIQRRDHAGDVEGLIVGGGVCGPETQVLRRHAHARKDGNRVHLDDTGTVPHSLAMVVAEDVRHGQAVVKKAEMEFAVLERLGDALVVLGTEKIRRRMRVAPRADVVRAVLSLHEPDQGHLALTGHHRRPLRSLGLGAGESRYAVFQLTSCCLNRLRRKVARLRRMHQAQPARCAGAPHPLPGEFRSTARLIPRAPALPEPRNVGKGEWSRPGITPIAHSR